MSLALGVSRRNCKEREGNPPIQLGVLVAVTACTAMALFYVAVLYAPTLILRLPPPTSLQVYMTRRFLCAFISTAVSVLVCVLILPVSFDCFFPAYTFNEEIRKMDFSLLLAAYGIRADHIWQAVVFPLSLTSLMYLGSMALKSLLLVDSWGEHMNHGEGSLLDSAIFFWTRFLDWVLLTVSNVLAWRNYVVAPLTEELVFRACMIPVLLSGGFKPTTVIFLCPILFSLGKLDTSSFWQLKLPYMRVCECTLISSLWGMTLFFSVLFVLFRICSCVSPYLYEYGATFQGFQIEISCSCTIHILFHHHVAAHLNHFMEYYDKQNNNLTKTVMVVGLQLCYTVVFGSYASFLFVRTGHLLAPLVAHVFCNFMGLPVLFSRRRGVVSLAFVVGMVGFLWLLFPMTSPHLFNEKTNNCGCWHGHCSWN
ncbi:CAAX prenyl protease 2, partial [Cucurbita argyrosperma subsp. argyrosperma]